MKPGKKVQDVKDQEETAKLKIYTIIN